LVGVGAVEDVDDALVKLTHVDGTVTVGVGLGEGGLRIVGQARRGRGQQRGRGEQNEQRDVGACGHGSALALDLPGTVGLAAGRAVSLLLLAAYGDRLLVLATVLAGGELIGLHRCDRAGVATVRIVPHGGLSGAVLLERLLRRLRR